MIVFNALGQLGRLGNQLFQVAATLSHAKRVEAEAVFNPWSYQENFERKITCRLDVGAMIIDGVQHEMVHQTKIHYVPIPSSQNLILNGWFQSWKYIDEELVKDYFRPSSALQTKINEAMQKLSYQGDIALHVRRGDYLNPFTPGYYKILDIDYYKKSLQFMISMLDITENISIFSDDIPWCRQEFSNMEIPVNFQYSEGNSDIVDLYLMASHKHHIISNSTYPWWGAWLRNVMNDSTDKQIVIAPKQYFGPPGEAEQTIKDLYCPGWYVI